MAPSPSEIWRPENIKISARFRTTSRSSREYLRNAARHRQSESSENSVANYGHFRTGKLNSVYFGPQKARNRIGVLTHPKGGHQAGHCHASSYYVSVWLIHVGQYCHFQKFLCKQNCLSVSMELSALLTTVACRCVRQ